MPMTEDKALLYFVHGLGGNAIDTWGEFSRLINDDHNLNAILDIGFFNIPLAYSAFHSLGARSGFRIWREDYGLSLTTDILSIST